MRKWECGIIGSITYTINRPLVSVVVPTYNRAKYIIDALDSIVMQTYRPLEIVIVDDGSTDDTQKVVDEWLEAEHGGFRLLYLSHPENMGCGLALKNGFRNATGEYICYLGSDDMFEGMDKIESQVRAMQVSGADWSYYRDFETGSRGPLFGDLVKPSYLPRMRFMDRFISKRSWLRLLILFWRNPINSSSLMVRASTYRQHGGWYEWTHNADCDGMFLMLWSYLKLKCVVLDGAPVFYRNHPGQVCKDRSSMKAGTDRTRRYMIDRMRKDKAPKWLIALARFFWWLR